MPSCAGSGPCLACAAARCRWESGRMSSLSPWAWCSQCSWVFFTNWFLKKIEALQYACMLHAFFMLSVPSVPTFFSVFTRLWRQKLWKSCWRVASCGVKTKPWISTWCGAQSATVKAVSKMPEFIWINKVYILRKPAGRLGVVSPCERSENKEGVWGRGVVDTGAFFGRNRRCLGCRFWVSGSRLYH